MRLSKIDIEKGIENKSIVIEPLFPNSIGGATADVHLGRHFKEFNPSDLKFLDLQKPVDPYMKSITLSKDKPQFVLHPGQFVLGVTEELIGVDLTHACKIDGVSSVARLGLFVHITASNINPGHKLYVTLELFNALNIPITLDWGMPIAQLEFYELKTPLKEDNDYKGFYGDEKEPTPSQYFRNYKPEKNEWIEFMCRKNGIHPLNFNAQ